MNNLKGVYAAIALTFVIAVIGLFTPAQQAVRGLLGAGATTDLPSLGLTTLYVGTGCDQQYTTCAASTLFPAGAIVTSGLGYFGQGITEGGLDSIATTSTAYTLAQSDLLNSSLVSFANFGGATTITLPASSTLTSFLPNAGDMETSVIYNASSSGALTISGGTGVTLLSASTTAVIQATKIGILKFIRLPNSNIVVNMSVGN